MCYHTYMVVYIEAVAIENLVVCYIVGAVSYRFLCVRHSWWRSLTAAMIGSVSAVFYPLFHMPTFAAVLCKVGFCFALSAILYAGKCNYVKGTLVFFICTFAFGGCVFFLGCLKYRSAKEAFNKPLSVAVWVVVAASFLLYYAARGLSVFFHRRRVTRRNLLRYKMIIGGRELEGYGFSDSGNRLYDIHSGLPVVVVGVGTVLPLLSDDEVTEILSGHAERVFAGARKMNCKSVGGVSQLILVQPDKFQVYYGSGVNIVYDVTVGLSFGKIAGSEEYNAILPSAFSYAN